MFSTTLSSILNSTVDFIVNKCLLTIFDCFISFLFVQIPIFCCYIIRLGKKNDQNEKQKRVRAKLINEDDPSSPYRAVEVLDKLETQPEKKVHTLAVIPDLCLKRYADKETMGVRKIFDVQEEKQKNGKIYKKVFILKKKRFFFKLLFKIKYLVNHG
jgi:hypothetical protein